MWQLLFFAKVVDEMQAAFVDQKNTPPSLKVGWIEEMKNIWGSTVADHKNPIAAIYRHVYDPDPNVASKRVRVFLPYEAHAMRGFYKNLESEEVGLSVFDRKILEKYVLDRPMETFASVTSRFTGIPLDAHNLGFYQEMLFEKPRFERD